MQEVFEKIIEKLKSEAKRWEDSGTEYKDKCEIAVGRGLRKAIEIVKHEAVQYNNGWIPCSERLPEPFENVLISTKQGGRAIGHRCPNQAYGRYYDLHSTAIDDVIAWQPLPEVPEQYQPKGE